MNSYLPVTICLCALFWLGALSASVPDYPVPGRLVEVNGRALHLNCSGSGTPTVVLDAGLGSSSLVWARVQPMAAKDTRVCSYDRAGYGWSQATVSQPPRTSAVIAAELHGLLHNAGITPPYVLVGHSFGGWNVRVFADRYPDEVAGLVLVDASLANQLQRYVEAGETPVAPQGQFVLFSPPALPPDLPASVYPVAKALAYRPQTRRTVYRELGAFRLSAAQVRASELPAAPLVVITRGRAPGHSPEAQLREALWQRLQHEFMVRHPGAMHLVADYSGHYVQLEQPAVVAAGICIAVQKARADNDAHGFPAGWLQQRCLRPVQAAGSGWRH